MSGDRNDKTGRGGGKVTSRRKLLASIAASSAAILVTGSVLQGSERERVDAAERTPEPTAPGTSTQTSDTSTQTPDGSGTDAASITEFGATKGEDTLSVARQNREAIRNAADEVGENGTVRIPPGEFYFGETALTDQLRFGKRAPKGVSFEGSGPRNSKLVFTASVDGDAGYRGFRYDGEDPDGDPIDHGDVVFRNLCFDGNYENLDLNGGRTVWGFNIYGDGNFTFDNVQVRGWWANGVRLNGPSAKVRRCRFQENAIGVAQAASERTAGHHISAKPSEGNSVVIEDCKFLRCSGTVINCKDGSGDLTLRRAWIRGVGYACFKISNTDAVIRAKNINFQPRTVWMLQNLPSNFGMDGRWFAYRLAGENYTPTVVLERVVANGMSWGFIRCFNDTDMILVGDMIAVSNAAIRNSQWAIRGDSGIKFDVGAISVHNTDGVVLDAPESTGTIEDMFRDGNTGLGNIGGVSLNDHPNAGRVNPDIVSSHEVGVEPTGGTDS